VNEDRFRREHSIRADVWRERPHIHYQQGPKGVEAVMVPETHFPELHQAALRAVTDWVNCAPGIAMARHPVPLSYPLPPIAAELRPEWPISVKRPNWHSHEQMGPKTREDHEQRRRVTVDDIRRGCFDYTGIDTEAYGFGDDHFELQGPPSTFPRVNEWHFHVDLAKYVFAPKEKTRVQELFDPHVHAEWWPEYESEPPLGGLWYEVLGSLSYKDAVLSLPTAMDPQQIAERIKAGNRIERLRALMETSAASDQAPQSQAYSGLG
jgi:hypothetical protein